MCGICGQVTFSGTPVNPDAIRAMTATLVHRGPDEDGYYFQPGVGLGMRRLKVLDLKTGQQPITNEDKSVWLVFNGEIYNYQELRQTLQSQGHRFTTQSDTEVIVHLYEEMGPACVDNLNGMFAFALWDEREQRLLLARDHLGIKPLYYSLQGGRLSFASELKALLVDGDATRKMDPASVADYFRWLYIPAPHTIFEGIKKLPPGSRLLMTAEGVRIEQYWRVEFPAVPVASLTEDEWAERLRAAIRSAVRRQMVADVPVGVFLSGGVDSSGIVAMARECVPGTLQTFSAGFPGMGLYDERAYAKRVADQFACEHHALEMTPSAVDALEIVIQACDEPFGDSSAIPLYFLARFAKNFVTVALSGTGGDDLFAGYRRYRMSQWLPRYQQLPPGVRRWLAHIVTALPAHRRSRWAEWSLYAKRFCAAAQNGASPMAAYLSTLTFFDEALRRELLPVGVTARELPAEQFDGEPSDPLNAYLLTDLTTYLPDDLLVKEDRMTMAVGLEARVPFLDLEVVRLALQMPSQIKLHGNVTKAVLRRALKPVLPESIVSRPKHGFAVPVGEWLKGDLAPLFQDTVLSPRAASRPWIAGEVARALFERHRQGREDLGQQLWALLVFEMWCRRYLERR